MSRLLIGLLVALMGVSTLSQAQTTDPAADAEQTDEATVAEKQIVAAVDVNKQWENIRKSSMMPYPFPFMVPPGSAAEWKPNTVMPPFPAEYKMAMLQGAGAASPFSMRQMFNFMSWKRKAKKGLSFDEVIEAMDSRAVEVNFKKVGHTRISTELAAKTGKPTPKLEILHYCDALVARKILDFSPEFAIFIPCRISVLEDANKDIWLITMDWDVAWMDFAWHPDSQMSEDLKQDARRLRSAMSAIMDAGATGDW